MRSFLKKQGLRCLSLLIVIAGLYGVGRAYYHFTDGFLESNINYDYPHELLRNTPPLSVDKKNEIASILTQEFYYLGKGCQSYVFSSKDGNYVLKFFKYQRFRPQAWLNYLTALPYIEKVRNEKINKKRDKLDYALSSWELAYEELQAETGVMYVHLNKSGEWNNKLVLFDKMGFRHEVDAGSTEFMLQKKATMLCETLLTLKKNDANNKAKDLIDNLLIRLLSEYKRGYADNDHALMQNTGVYDGTPIHIDVGQFVKNPIASDPKIYHQELFNKMWKFRLWLKKNYAELANHVEIRLKEIIGPTFETFKPELNKAAMGRIPVQKKSRTTKS